VTQTEQQVAVTSVAVARHIFLDLETTGLEAGFDDITEFGWILDDGTERQFFVEHFRQPSAWVLEKTDYRTRVLPAPKWPLRHVLAALAGDCEHLAAGGGAVYVVGACPAFDDRFLRHAYSTAFAVPRDAPYNYHVIDIEAVAMGFLGHDAPCKLSELREALGISGENPAKHTALADAAEVKLIWDTLRARARGIA
jgi:DNA polymerase III alpha subunit (gram-positive type)